MSIKRTLFAFSALMMLPVVALAQPVAPPISPAPDTANIAVVKTFLDGNSEDSSVVTLTCATGTISPSSATLKDGEGVVFVVSNIPTGTANPCTLTQTVPGDYDAFYLCDPTADIAGDDQCGNPTEIPETLSETSCSWADVTADNVGYCAVYNRATPVDVDVTKVWETFGAEQADFDPSVGISLNCPDAIEVCAGTICSSSSAFISLSEGAGDFEDEDGNYIGEGVAEFTVVPTWYPTESDPDDQLFTECTATESGVSSSAVEVDNGCGDIEVEAGMGDECTITNTVFFEGIPTLSQYGMAIMALLMLGVGFIGMRRFV